MFKMVKSKVLSLGLICIDKIVKMIEKVIKDDAVTKTHYDTLHVIMMYFQSIGMTAEVQQNILHHSLQITNYSTKERLTFLDLFLNHTVTCLVTDHFPPPYYHQLGRIISGKGIGLREINMKGIYFKAENMYLLFEIIQKCRYLRKLIVPHMGTDGLLRMISKYSYNLKMLDISGKTYVTSEGIQYLSEGVCNDELVVLNIGALRTSNITYDKIATLLENCPNIEFLHAYDYVGKSLKIVYERNAEFKCKLRFVYDAESDAEMIRIILKTCPKLESLHLSRPMEGSLHELRNVNNLTKLIVAKFLCSELMKVLEIIGQGIEDLILIRSMECLDLCEVARCCPSLVEFQCESMKELKYRNSKTTFNSLLTLLISSSPIANEDLVRLLCNSLQLVRLSLDRFLLTDDDIINIFVKHEFNRLEYMKVTYAPYLHRQSFQTIIEHCPSLQKFGSGQWCFVPENYYVLRSILSGERIQIMPFGYYP